MKTRGLELKLSELKAYYNQSPWIAIKGVVRWKLNMVHHAEVLEDLRAPNLLSQILTEKFLIPMGTTRGELASRLGCYVNVINRIVDGRVDMSAEMAQKRAAEFNTTPEFRLNAQKSADIYNAAKKIKHLPKPRRLADDN